MMQVQYLQYTVLLVLNLFLTSTTGVVKDASTFSPFYQELPNCKVDSFKRITKLTTAKAILCPMIK
jgi:hypothetical protein